MYVNEVANSSDKLKVFKVIFLICLLISLEEINGMKTELYLEKYATPIFSKPRTATYVLRAAVNNELQSEMMKILLNNLCIASGQLLHSHWLSRNGTFINVATLK